MKIQDWFENWGITGMELSAGFLKMEWKPQPEEEQAAWELYVELITRITTQPLSVVEGDEETALESVAMLFPITRELLKAKGRKAETFSKIAIVILNQKIRPFTAHWHKQKERGLLATNVGKREFRDALRQLQPILQGYAGLLATVAGVEDFLKIEQGPMDKI